MNYAFEHQGKAYTPDGTVQVSNVDEHNKELERAEIEWLKTGPEKVMLYAGKHESQALGWKDTRWTIQTWLGTDVASHVYIGERKVSGFQSCFKGGTYRRAVECRIFGVKYHGWYMESSGDYCKLTRNKHQ